jgi:GAF domain-containing protein
MQAVKSKNRSVNSRTRQQDDALLRLRLQVANVLLVLFGVASLSGALISLIYNKDAFQSNLPEIAIFTLSGAIAVTAYFFIRYERYQSFCLNIVPFLALLISLLVGWWGELLLLMIIITVVSAALLCDRYIYLAVCAATIVRLAFHFGGLWADLPEARALKNGLVYLGILASIFAVPFLISILARYAINTLRQSSDQTTRAAQLLSATTSIGQEMLRLLDLNELLSRAVEVIRDRFGYFHVQIYLLDETRSFAVLVASTGDVGQQLLSRQYRLPLSRPSLIARAAQAGEPVSTKDTNDPNRQFDIMPNIGSEMAIPITDGETIIGVLDIQSMRRGPELFTIMEQQVLQVMTSQLATAIRNARLFEAQEQSLRENKRLFLDAETNLREIQRLNRQLTRQTWEEYLTANRAVGGVTLDRDSFHPGADWSDRMMQAGLRRRPMTTRQDDRAFIAVPVELRGEVIGAMEVEIPTDLHSEGIIDMMQAIADRLAISLDNARLFEETQEATAQEQRINEIVSRYQSASTVDDLLQVTLEGLFETLGAEAASIRLGNVTPNTRPMFRGLETQL